MAAAMIFGFHRMGMVGLGLGILVSNLFDCISVWCIAAIRYGFRYSRRVWGVCVTQLPMMVLMLVVVRLCSGWCYFLFGATLVLVSTLSSLHFLRRHTDFLRRFSKR